MLVKLRHGQEIRMKCIAVRVGPFTPAPPLARADALDAGQGTRARQVVPRRSCGIRVRPLQQVTAHRSVVRSRDQPG